MHTYTHVCTYVYGVFININTCARITLKHACFTQSQQRDILGNIAISDISTQNNISLTKSMRLRYLLRYLAVFVIKEFKEKRFILFVPTFSYLIIPCTGL